MTNKPKCQVEKSRDAAREHECDPSSDHFEDALRTICMHKPDASHGDQDHAAPEKDSSK
jgi:hypothetical protein